MISTIIRLTEVSSVFLENLGVLKLLYLTNAHDDARPPDS